MKPDGTQIFFICLIEQIAAVQAGQTVHVVGKAPAELRRLKRICTLTTIAA
jgi:hypothetical protein